MKGRLDFLLPVEGLADHALHAAVVLAVSLAIAWAVGRLVAAWAARHVGRHEAVVRGIGRHTTLLIALVGIYASIATLHIADRALIVVGNIMYVLTALVGVRLFTRVGLAVLRGYFDARTPHEADLAARERAEKEYLPLASTLVTIAVAMFGIIVVAHHFGYEVSSLVAALGVGSLAIGLAAQQTLGNMFGGFVLLVDKPFRPGDRIKLATGEIGEVREIGIRSTRILLADENLLIVPNTELANSRVINYALPSEASAGEVRLELPLATDVDAVAEAMLAAVRAQPERLEAPAPSVQVVSLGTGGLALSVRFHVDRHVAVSAVEERVRRALVATVRGVAQVGK